MYEGRQAGRLTPQKLEFARTAAEADKLPSGSSLLEATQQLQPSALIGAAAKQGAFTADVIEALTKVKLLWLCLYPFTVKTSSAILPHKLSDANRVTLSSDGKLCIT